MSELGLFDRIRQAAEAVSRRARFVHIDDERLEALAAELLFESEKSPGVVDPIRHQHSSPEEMLAYVVTLDAVNFGSGWFPYLRKRPGCSGYFTIAGALKDHFASRGAWDAEELVALSAEQCAAVFEQEGGSSLDNGEGDPIFELMDLFARALGDLGQLLRDRYDGSFAVLVESAGGRAENLARRLSEMPFYRDESRYEELEVPLYKRAQLTASDLAKAFSGEGYGRFDDLHELTIFADNLVPHVLRREGVLRYSDDLAQRIDREEALQPGSMQEVEIRAVAVHAVERMAEFARSAASGEGAAELTSCQLDSLLWDRGHRPDMKAHPRHRARSVFY